MAAFSIVITGGPGSGKTSICEYLKEMSYQTYPENARRLIKEGIRPPIAMTNSAQLSSFGDKVLKNRISDYKDSLKYELCFFDRGIPDGLAFSYFMNKQADQTLINAIDKYRYDQIFTLWNCTVYLEYLKETGLFRAENGIRTRDPQLGKLMLYH